MKKLLSLKNVLIYIAFAVLLLFLKDNIDIAWDIICNFASILTPFLIGLLFAYIFNFPYKFFRNKVFGKMGTKRKYLLKLKKPLSIVLTYASVFALMAVIVAIIVPQIAININNLIESMPEYFDVFLSKIDVTIDWANSTLNLGIDKNNAFNEVIIKVFDYFSGQNISKLAGDTTTAIIGMLTSTTEGIYNFIMGIIISVYLISAKEQLCRQVKRLAVAYIPIKYLPKLYEIIDITDTKCGRYIIGSVMDATFIGLLTFITMSIFRLPYAPLIAVIIGVSNIIPFFGPFIGAIPSAFILLLIDPWDMIKFVIIIFVIQQLDGNIFNPKIVGGQVGLSSFWVLFSVIVGGALFGVVGLILATPIYAVIYTLVKKNVRIKIKEKGKIAQEALDFEVLNYTKIAEEQKKIREEKESAQRERIMKLIHFNKTAKDDSAETNEDAEKVKKDDKD